MIVLGQAGLPSRLRAGRAAPGAEPGQRGLPRHGLRVAMQARLTGRGCGGAPSGSDTEGWSGGHWRVAHAGTRTSRTPAPRGTVPGMAGGAA